MKKKAYNFLFFSVYFLAQFSIMGAIGTIVLTVSTLLIIFSGVNYEPYKLLIPFFSSFVISIPLGIVTANKIWKEILKHHPKISAT